VAVVQRIYRLALSMGYSELADCLNRDGILGPCGGLWCSTTLRDLLMNPAYKGDLVFNRTSKARYHTIHDGEIVPLDEFRAGRLNFADNPEDQWIVIPAAHEALIAPAEWDAAREAIETRRTGVLRTPRSPNRFYPLSGIAFCARCGGPLQGNTQRAHNGKVYPRYICATAQKYGKSKCPRASVDAEELESLVMGKIHGEMTSSCVLDHLREGLERRFDEQRRFRESAADYRKQLEALAREKSAIFARLSGNDLAFFQEQINEMREREDRLRTLETSAKEKATIGTDKAAFVEKHLNFYEQHVLALKGGCENSIRETLRALHVKVIFHPDGKEDRFEVSILGRPAGD
jgi:hypothetical protein